jgi:hypothetical protein
LQGWQIIANHCSTRTAQNHHALRVAFR